MKKIVLLTSILMTLAVAAYAQAPMGGLGFRSGADLTAGMIGFGASPTVGVRQWFTSQVGVDAAIGFATLSTENNVTPSPTLDDKATAFAIDLGVPVVLKSWDKVNFILRPGFIFSSAKFEDKIDPTPPNEQKVTVFAVTGEFEVEWMVAEKVGISASHGIAYFNAKDEINSSPAFEVKSNGFSTIGGNFTQLGFHVYLW